MVCCVRDAAVDGKKVKVGPAELLLPLLLDDGEGGLVEVDMVLPSNQCLIMFLFSFLLLCLGETLVTKRFLWQFDNF